jgi:hypothetical protein
MYPPNQINLGEVWTKQIYGAVCGSHQWNNTLFSIITIDEYSVCSKLNFSYYQLRFINPPQVFFSTMFLQPLASSNPDGLTYYSETAPDGKNHTFDFTRRLEVRCVSI